MVKSIKGLAIIKKIDKLLGANWGYKMGAVLIAIALWVMVTVSANPLDERTFPVAIIPQNLESDLSMLETTNQVNIRVQGTSAVLNNLTNADFQATIDLIGLRAGQTSVEVQITAPDNITVLSLTPATIEVELKDIATESFPLEVEIIGEPPANYLMHNPLLSPEEISLSGPEDYLNLVSRVYVVADLNQIEDLSNPQYQKNTTIMVEDFNGNDITSYFTNNIYPLAAQVTVPIFHNRPEEIIPIRISLTNEVAPGYQLSLYSATPNAISVFGDLNDLQALSHISTAPIDLSNLNISTSLEVPLEQIAGLDYAQDTVTVSLQIEPIASKNFTILLTHSQNVFPGMTAEVNHQPLDISVYGADSFIDDLSSDEIIPYVDCTGLQAGVYDLPVEVSLPANIYVMNINPTLINVEISPNQETDEIIFEAETADPQALDTEEAPNTEN